MANNLKSNASKYLNDANSNKALPDVFKELEQMRKSGGYVQDPNYYEEPVKNKKGKLSNKIKFDNAKDFSQKAQDAVKNSTQKVKSRVNNIKNKIDNKKEQIKEQTKKTSNKIQKRVTTKQTNLYLDDNFDLPKSSYQLKHMAEMQKIAAEEARIKEQEKQLKVEEKAKKALKKEQEKELKLQAKIVKKQNKAFEKEAKKAQKQKEEEELIQEIYDKDVMQANQNAVELLYQKAQRVNMMANGVSNVPIENNEKTIAKNKKKLAKKVQREKLSTYIRTKSFKDPVAIAFVIAIAVLGTLIVQSFITDSEIDGSLEVVAAQEKREEKIVEKREVVGGYEKNYQSINISQILEQNLQTLESKELITVEQDIPYETEYVENSKLPTGEQLVIQVGRVGKEEVSFIRTYENDEAVNDTIININTITTPIVEVVEVGSNQFLANLGAHLNETVYVKDNTSLMMVADTRGQEIGTLVKYYDVTLLDILDNGWAQVKIYDYVGYCDSSMLVSRAQDSSIADKSRRQKIVKNVNENMALNVKSGLKAEDYIRILSNITADKNKIFEQNAMVFYNVEQEYEINGIFLAAIGIHESGWGTSAIALNKNNLFGYGAYDSDPYNMSLTFATYEEGIALVARNLVKYYLNVPGSPIFDNQSAVGTYYNGPTVAGVNVRYASDQNWHTKVYNTMVSLYNRIAPD